MSKTSPQAVDLRLKFILFLLFLFSYTNSLHNGFLLDDYALLLDNNLLREVAAGDLFTKGFFGFYRPFAFLFVKFELLAFGANVAGYHVLNLALLYAVVVMVYCLVRELSDNRELAFLAAALFAAHPINNMLVNYCTAGALSLAVLWMQASAVLFIQFLRRDDLKFFWGSVFFYLAGLLTHETTFILPAYLLAVCAFFFPDRLKRFPRILLGYAVVFLAYFLMRSNAVLAPHLFDAGLSPAEYLTTFARLMGWYASKLFAPKDILFLWDVPVINADRFGLEALLLVGALISAFLIAARSRKTIYTFALVMLGIGLVPVIMAAFTYTWNLKTALIEPHWLLFPSIGFFTLIAGLLLLIRRGVSKQAWLLLIILIMGSLILATRHHNSLWATDNTYCTYWLKLNPYNSEPWDCKARVYLRTHFKGADLNNYENCKELTDLAGAYRLNRRPDLSEKYYRMALDKDPRCASAYYGLGLQSIDTMDLARADEYFAKAISLNVAYKMCYDGLQNTLKKGSDIETVREIRRLIKNDIPGF